MFNFQIQCFLLLKHYLEISYLFPLKSDFFFALLSSALLSFEALLNTVSAAVLLSFN